MRFTSYFDYEGQGSGPSAAPSAAFLADLGAADWDRLLTYMDLLRCRAGQTVRRTGEADRALYVVAEGALQAVGPAGDTVETVEAGGVAGVATFFLGGPAPDDLRAPVDSEVLRLDFDQFEAMAAREPALARAVLWDLGKLLCLQRAGG